MKGQINDWVQLSWEGKKEEEKGVTMRHVIAELRCWRVCSAEGPAPTFLRASRASTVSGRVLKDMIASVFH